MGRDADVLLGSHDKDFIPRLEQLVGAGSHVDLISFPEQSARAREHGSRAADLWPLEGMEMRPSTASAAHRDAVRAIVLAHRVVDPTPETTWFDIGAIRSELLELLRVPVDAVTPNELPTSFRSRVLAEAVPL